MGLFSFFNRKNGNGITDVHNPSTAQVSPEIPENVFIEKEKPTEETRKTPEFGINHLFEFLERNFESKGYEDALMNPDITHMDQNNKALKSDLERTIRKVKTFYLDFIREVDFHIASRARSGMIDMVEELTVKKQTAESHVQQVNEIETEANQGNGVGQSIIISYSRGFRNGLAAISHHSILRKNF